MRENKTIKKAIGELERVSGDEKLQRIAELREKAIRDEKAEIAYAKEHGYKEGFEKGIADGKAQGIDQGIYQGIEQVIEQGIAQGKFEGATEEKRKIVRRMLERNMDIKDIIEITGLDEEEINNIKMS